MLFIITTVTGSFGEQKPIIGTEINHIHANIRKKIFTVLFKLFFIKLTGGITYLRDDFGESGGEYLFKIYLEHKDNRWAVIKTDEYTLHEFKE